MGDNEDNELEEELYELDNEEVELPCRNWLDGIEYVYTKESCHKLINALDEFIVSARQEKIIQSPPLSPEEAVRYLRLAGINPIKHKSHSITGLITLAQVMLGSTHEIKSKDLRRKAELSIKNLIEIFKKEIKEE